MRVWPLCDPWLPLPLMPLHTCLLESARICRSCPGTGLVLAGYWVCGSERPPGASCSSAALFLSLAEDVDVLLYALLL